MKREARSCIDENFIKCYSKYLKTVIKHIKKIVYNQDTAEELAQDVFIKLYEKNLNLDPDSLLTLKLLFTAARHIAIDYSKRQSNEAKKYMEIHFEDVVMNNKFYENIENAYVQGQIISTLHDSINSFPEKERNIFIEKNFNNKNSSFLSRNIKISSYQIRKIENDVKDKIKDNLHDFFI